MSLTKDRPILFRPEMVRAILDGRKTQTRRIVRPQPCWLPEVRSTRLTGPFFWPVGGLGQQCGMPITRTPYGLPGERLWVRETWGTVRMHELGQHVYAGPRVPDRDYVVYRAGREWGVPIPGTSPPQFRTEWREDIAPPRWRSSIHMPRWASRLLLEITEVRVQRLQEINEEDAKAEGVHRLPLQEGIAGAWWTADVSAGIDLQRRTPTRAFVALWDRYNGKRAPWSSNPWVWAISFRRVSA